VLSSINEIGLATLRRCGVALLKNLMEKKIKIAFAKGRKWWKKMNTVDPKLQ